MCNKVFIMSQYYFYFFTRSLMKAPTHLDFTPEQIETLIERLDKQALIKEDYPVLANLIKAIVWMNFSYGRKIPLDFSIWHPVSVPDQVA